MSCRTDRSHRTQYFQRKVKFPTEFDALDLVTDDLKEKLVPVSRRLKELEKERGERRKVRKRTKIAAEGSSAGKGKAKDGDVEMADAAAPAEAGSSAEGEKKEPVAGAELEEENVYREKELKELEALVHPDLKADVGCSVSGLYELVGASHSLITLSQKLALI